jgi:hypothetical protein
MLCYNWRKTDNTCDERVKHVCRKSEMFNQEMGKSKRVVGIIIDDNSVRSQVNAPKPGCMYSPTKSGTAEFSFQSS